jgi:hypothetical protein
VRQDGRQLGLELGYVLPRCRQVGQHLPHRAAQRSRCVEASRGGQLVQHLLQALLLLPLGCPLPLLRLLLRRLHVRVVQQLAGLQLRRQGVQLGRLGVQLLLLLRHHCLQLRLLLALLVKDALEALLVMTQLRELPPGAAEWDGGGGEQQQQEGAGGDHRHNAA